MKEAFEKIIERLEEASHWETVIDADGYAEDVGEVIYLDKAIEIVNQVAEEFSHRNADLVIEASHSNDCWIPCVNELPQEYTDVLGCDYDGYIYVVQLYKDSIYGKIWRQWNGGMLRLDVIIAWQPLPPSYKPKEK